MIPWVGPGQRWPLALQTFGAMCRLRCSNEATPLAVEPLKVGTTSCA